MPRFSRRLTLSLVTAIASITAVAMPAGATASAVSATIPVTQARAQQIGTDAYVYGISLMEFRRQQQTQTSVTVPNALSDAPLNQLGNAPATSPTPPTRCSCSPTTTRSTRWVTST